MLPRPRGCHMTDADCEQAQQQVNDSDHPMKFTQHERRLGQAKDDHESANGNRNGGDDPPPGMTECLCNCNDPQSTDRNQPK